MKIESLLDLRPGDIMISAQSTAPNKVIVYGGQFLIGDHFRVGRFAAGHAGIITPGYKLVEAMPSGARERDLRESDWSAGHWYFRLPVDYYGQNLDAAAIARAMVETPYSWMSYGYLAAHRFGLRTKWLENRINRRHDLTTIDLPSKYKDPYIQRDGGVRLPVEAICSVLADQAWSLTGYEVVRGTKPQVVTPGMLARQLFSRPDVIRGGLGLL